MASRNAAAPTTAKNIRNNLIGPDGALASRSTMKARLLRNTESIKVSKPTTRNALADGHCTGIKAADNVMQPKPKNTHAIEILNS